jgi:hypothetical protein
MMDRGTQTLSLLLLAAAVAFGVGGCCGGGPGPAQPPQPPPPPAASGAVQVDKVPPPGTQLTGVVDLHAHPMANLGYAGKLMYGGGYVGALLPATPDCREDVRAASVDEALGHDGAVHGSWGLDLNPLDLLAGRPIESNRCGDYLRQLIVKAVQDVNDANNPASNSDGYPDFQSWPKWNDILHQAMWIDWIKRAHDLGGLNVMVALAVNNETLADAVRGSGDGPDDDMASADLQIAEIKTLVAQNSAWMEIANSSADLRRIVYTITGSRWSWAWRSTTSATSTGSPTSRRRTSAPRLPV